MPVLEIFLTKGSKKNCPNSSIGGSLRIYEEEEHPVCSLCGVSMPVVATLNFDAFPFSGMTPWSGFFRACACTEENCPSVQKKTISFETLHFSGDSEGKVSSEAVTKYKPHTFTSQRFGTTTAANSYILVEEDVTIKIDLTPLSIAIPRNEKIYRLSSITIGSIEGNPVITEYVFSAPKGTPKPSASSAKSTPLKKARKPKPEGPSVLTPPKVPAEEKKVSQAAKPTAKVKNLADLLKKESPSASSPVQPASSPASVSNLRPARIATVEPRKAVRSNRANTASVKTGEDWQPAPALVAKKKKATRKVRKTEKERRRAFYEAQKARTEAGEKEAEAAGEGEEEDAVAGEGDEVNEATGEGDEEDAVAGEGDQQ
jgi:hypothetical protein